MSRLADALNGLPILGCLSGSPAAQAGIRYGDVLLSIDGVATPTWDDFIEVRGKCVGMFRARVFRDGAELEFDVPLRPSNRSPMELLEELVNARILGGEPEPPEPAQ